MVLSGEGSFRQKAAICWQIKYTMMLRKALIFALLAEAVHILGQLLFAWREISPEYSEILGYCVMLVALSMIYFGIRNYRDQQLNGKITFGQGLQLGLLITLIASVIYVATWMIYYQNGGGVEMMEAYWESQVADIRSSGQTEAEITAQLERLTNMRESYSKPWVMAGFTFLEIFPVGLIISLLAAFLLRTKKTEAVLPG